MTTIVDIETSGLAPTDSYITAIGIMDDNGIREFSSPARMFRYHPIQAEKELLQRAVSADLKDDILVSYNGESFDVPFIKTRLLFHSLPEIKLFLTKKHIDLFHFAKEMNDGVRIAKDYAANKFCNLYAKNSSGAFIAAVYRQKIVSDEEHIEMLSHLALDLTVTKKMFDKFNTYPEFEAFYTLSHPEFREWCPAPDGSRL